MRVDALQDTRTRRIDRIELKADTFQDEMSLTHMNNAFWSGRAIQIEISDDEVYAFRLKAKPAGKEQGQSEP